VGPSKLREADVQFSTLEPLPPDPILGMAQMFANDPAPNKVDLGIGVYKDETGQAKILDCVKAAERVLLETQTTKAYLSSAGNPAFNTVTAELLFGPEHPALAEGRVRTVQTPGGTSALRVAADFLRAHNPGATIWLPKPTWANHGAIFAAAGLTVAEYPYYDAAGARLRFEEMLDALAAARPGDVVLLHGCCHNPTGADPDHAQWAELARLLQRTGATPLVDLAYQGFGEGLDEDAHAVRLLAAQLPELIVASSYSKNFALYRDRAGALTVVSAPGVDADRVRAHLMRVIRTNYSMPPDHGAAVVATILGEPRLRTMWQAELAVMRQRIREIRQLLAKALNARSPNDYAFIGRQNGMFTTLSLTGADVVRLREVHHIHASASGRINVAGLTKADIDHLADALASLDTGRAAVARPAAVSGR
jgi:aspartate aminotransferase